MNVLDLFSGIGGFSLGLERAGMSTVAFCEIEPYARAVLKKNWPGVPIYDDVRTLSRARLAAGGVGRVDVICGGFPCQDISLAGRGAGLAGERSGLWHEYARLIEEIRPAWVIIENVSALRSRGLDQVLGALAALGYDAEWHCIPASAVGAPHRRDRVWIVAHPKRCELRVEPGRGGGACRAGAPLAAKHGEERPVADAARLQPGRQEQWTERERAGAGGQSELEVVADANRPVGRSETRDAIPGASSEALCGRAPELGRCGADVADPLGERLEGGTNIVGDTTDQLATAERGRAVQRLTIACRNQWLAEPDVRGMVDGPAARLDGGLDGGQGVGAPVGASVEPENRLRTVWLDLAARAASQGPRSDEQLARELADALPDLSHAIALGRGQEPLAAARRFLHRLRQAFEALGVLRDASDPLPSAWQSAPREEADRAFLAACGRADWCLGEWPGVERVAVGVRNRVARLRALGNAVVPQVVEIIGRAILTSSG